MSKRRYEGSPFLRLLELSILRSIGRIDHADAKNMSELTPKLQLLYNHGGEWDEIVFSVLSLPLDFPTQLENEWRDIESKASQKDRPVTPQAFAESVADRLTRVAH